VIFQNMYRRSGELAYCLSKLVAIWWLSEPCHDGIVEYGGETYLLGAHEIPTLETDLETFDSLRGAGVGLGPASPQGSEGVCVIDLMAEEVTASPLIELNGLNVGRLFVLNEFVKSH
jgi:hypothetical protein